MKKMFQAEANQSIVFRCVFTRSDTFPDENTKTNESKSEFESETCFTEEDTNNSTHRLTNNHRRLN